MAKKRVWNPLNALIISRIISRNQITVKRGTFDKRLLGFCKVLQENDKRLSVGAGYYCMARPRGVEPRLLG
jgi:hypothetical protein